VISKHIVEMITVISQLNLNENTFVLWKRTIFEMFCFCLLFQLIPLILLEPYIGKETRPTDFQTSVDRLLRGKFFGKYVDFTLLYVHIYEKEISVRVKQTNKRDTINQTDKRVQLFRRSAFCKWILSNTIRDWNVSTVSANHVSC